MKYKILKNNLSIYDNVLFKKLLNISITTIPNILLIRFLDNTEFIEFLLLVSMILIMNEFLCFGGSLENSKKQIEIKKSRQNRNTIGLVLSLLIVLYLLNTNNSIEYYLLITIPYLMANSISVYENKICYKRIYTNELILSFLFLIVKIFFLRDINSYIWILFLETLSKHLNIELSLGIELKRYKTTLTINNNHIYTGLSLVIFAFLTRANIFFIKESDNTENIILFLTSTSFGILYNYILVNKSLDWEKEDKNLNRKLLLFSILYPIVGFVIISIVKYEVLSSNIIWITYLIIFVQIKISKLLCVLCEKKYLFNILILSFVTLTIYNLFDINNNLILIMLNTFTWYLWIIVYKKLIY